MWESPLDAWLCGVFLGGGGVAVQFLCALLDLWQSDLQGVSWAFDGQDEGVLIGVILDDVVVHVDQDPD